MVPELDLVNLCSVGLESQEISKSIMRKLASRDGS